MFAAALFVTVPHWKQPQCPPTVPCMKYLWDVYNSESATDGYVEETYKHNTEQKKTDTTGDLLYGSIYIKCKMREDYLHHCGAKKIKRGIITKRQGSVPS